MVKIVPSYVTDNRFKPPGTNEGLTKVQKQPKVIQKQKKKKRNYSIEKGLGNDHADYHSHREPSPTDRKSRNQFERIPSPTKKGGNSPSRRNRAKCFRKNNYRGSPNGSKSTHDMPMGKKDLYFALDCEMVGVGPHGTDSALARVSVVNWDGETVLDTFVKVDVPVTDFRTFVSGVRSEDIESSEAMDLKQVRTKVRNILRGKILIGHGLENDLKALNITHPSCDTRDTATFVPYMREVVDIQNRRKMIPKRLKDLAWEELGKQIQVLGDAHSSIEDGMTALELYKAARPKWEAIMSEKVKIANELEVSRIRKAAFFTKRHERPVPTYQQMYHKQYNVDTLPIAPPNHNLYVRNHLQPYFAPVQDPRFISHPQDRQHLVAHSTQWQHPNMMLSNPRWKYNIVSN